MTTIRSELEKIISSALESHADGTFSSRVNYFSEWIERLIEPAVTNEKDTVRYIVSLLNLLLDIRRGILEHAAYITILRYLSNSLDRPEFPSHFYLQGEEATAEKSPEDQFGCTMIRWSDFCRFYAPRYGKARTPAELDKLWRRVTAGRLRIPKQDLSLTSNSGVVWITDDKALHDKCLISANGQIDGTKAYDCLGLDWLSGWTYTGALAEARAILLKSKVSHRRNSGRGLRVPNSVDAWGGIGFVPRRAQPPRKWPSNAGMTVNPVTGEEVLPEAIHGLSVIPAGEDCEVIACSTVKKALPDRVDECGKAVCRKAIAAFSEG